MHQLFDFYYLKAGERLNEWTIDNDLNIRQMAKSAISRSLRGGVCRVCKLFAGQL